MQHSIRKSTNLDIAWRGIRFLLHFTISISCSNPMKSFLWNKFIDIKLWILMVNNIDFLRKCNWIQARNYLQDSSERRQTGAPHDYTIYPSALVLCNLERKKNEAIDSLETLQVLTTSVVIKQLAISVKIEGNTGQ